MNEVISDVLAIGAVVGLFGMLGAVIWLAAVNEYEIKKERHRGIKTKSSLRLYVKQVNRDWNSG